MTNNRADWIDSLYLIGIIVPVKIATPLEDVAEHVVKSPGIRSKLTDGMRVLSTVSQMPPDGIHFLFVIPVVVGGCCAGPTSIFPFGFRGEPVRLVLFAAEPVAKYHGVIPTDIDHRIVIGLTKTRIPP